MTRSGLHNILSGFITGRAPCLHTIGEGFVRGPDLGTASFPVVSSITTSHTSVDNPSHIVNLGAYSAGDLLIIAITISGNSIIASPPTGWTALATDIDSGAGSRPNMYIYYKVADGSEGSSVTVTSNSSTWSAQLAYVITGWSGTPECAEDEFGHASGTANTIDPPSLTPSWGSANTLWIVFGACNSATVNSGPSGYSGLSTVATTSHGALAMVITTAWAQIAAASEDPGAFSLSTAVQRVAATVAVKPA
jgi:hypothetical protein